MLMSADGTASSHERLFAASAALMQRDPTQWSMSDWGRLAALVDVDTKHVLTPLHERIDGHRSIQQLAMNVLEGYSRADHTMQAAFDEILPRLDPQYLAKRQAALREAIAGGPIPRGATLTEFRSLEEFDTLQSSVRAGVAARILEHTNSVTVPGARQFLDDVDHVLGELDGAPAQLQPVRERIERLVQVNRSRIGGHTPAGAVRGYSNHPDYAELGRIRADLAFLAKATTPRPAAPAAAPTPASAPAAASIPGSATEILSW
jgi:hypothetical protein